MMETVTDDGGDAGQRKGYSGVSAHSSLAAHRSAMARRLDRLGIGAPFGRRYHQGPQGPMHYVDEGEGPVLLMLHGNPSWSYLYRHMINGLCNRYRVVVPDRIGFGLSAKPSKEGVYSIDQHARNLESLVEALDLRNVTLFMQDWGGPIGLTMASRHPDRIAGIVVMNTFGFYPPVDDQDPDNLKLPLPLRLMRTRGLGDFLVRRLGFFEGQAMPMGTHKTRAFKRVHAAYKGMFISSAERAGVMAFPRLIPTNRQHPTARLMMEESGPFVQGWKGPAKIFWGMKDPFFPEEALDAWKLRLPQADVTELHEAGHYGQEDMPDEIVAGLRSFMADQPKVKA